MNRKFNKLVFNLTVIQAFVYVIGFIVSVIFRTISPISWLNIYSLSSFTGTIYWSTVSVLSIIGFAFVLYMLIAFKLKSIQKIGLILSIIGFVSPIIFSFFMIIPAAIIITAAIFNSMHLKNSL